LTDINALRRQCPKMAARWLRGGASRWREKSEIPAIDLDGAEFVYDGPPVDAAAEPAIAA